MAGTLNILGKKGVSAFLLIVATVIMGTSKDNPKIVSDIAAINREKDVRLEWFATDVSLLGVALIFLGGMGG